MKKLCTMLFAIFGLFAARQQCVFDRNEIGPMGAHGQWWYDVYKCPDGTERRVLVAGPRG
jgi:hypothetical protein